MKRRVKRAQVKRREIEATELVAILERARVGPLGEEDLGKLKAAVDTLVYLSEQLGTKGVSVERLRRILFGSSTEKTSRVLGEPRRKDGGGAGAGNGKRKGHGRNGAAAYRGADRVKVANTSLTAGDPCPECDKGKVYPMAEPAVLVRVKGVAPLDAVVYELERLRCNLCGEVFTAAAPEGIGEAKYDETAAAMIGLVRYGCGFPFNRLERLQADMGIPLPAATQWELVKHGSNLLAPAHHELVRQAAQGEVLHNDDTGMKILAMMKEGASRTETDAETETKEDGAAAQADKRTAVHTTGIVAVTRDGHKIALFFTGHRHAGENLSDLLARRAAELGPPIQMCDALAANTAGGPLDTIVANCLVHARRSFVDVAADFPDEVRFVLEKLREVFVNDAAAARDKLSADERLAFHQARSKPVMDELEVWLKAQIDDHLVEPNSRLGGAIKYMIRHWDQLTLFLRQAGAPLDNNLVERALKKAILHRKSSLFYKTENGARVGDRFMSLIHTAELVGADPFDYLVQLQRHHEEVSKNPGDWMPWCYKEAAARSSPAPPPSG